MLKLLQRFSIPIRVKEFLWVLHGGTASGIYFYINRDSEVFIKFSMLHILSFLSKAEIGENQPTEKSELQAHITQDLRRNSTYATWKS